MAAAEDDSVIERPQSELPTPDESVGPGAEEDVDPSIRVTNLDITYRVHLERKASLKNHLIKRMRGERPTYREVRAVRDVSFTVPKGSCTGIIGANGAGKSTIMRALAGILPPTDGQIEVFGKVSTLLALGVGFNAALTGRENVTLGGMAAGLSRAEVTEKFDEIAEFAELGDFIDMPMRTYSSGMYSRLAFAVSVHMEPDILLIDEALSAGDAKFKEKASQKMDDLIRSAGSMVLVSHSLATIQDLAKDVLWLHNGKLIKRGNPDEVCAAYMEYLKVGSSAAVLEDI